MCQTNGTVYYTTNTEPVQYVPGTVVGASVAVEMGMWSSKTCLSILRRVSFPLHLEGPLLVASRKWQLTTNTLRCIFCSNRKLLYCSLWIAIIASSVSTAMLLSASLRSQVRLATQNARRVNTRWLSSTESPESADESQGHSPVVVVEEAQVLDVASGKPGLDRSEGRPTDIVKSLDRHIVGQQDAKRAIAIAMRNRWRRQQLPPDIMKDVTPRNVLMIGPTGCGKTEIARRTAALGDAPFLKVEATKFTEVGFHGRDVDQIIRDLVEVAITMIKRTQREKLREAAKQLVEDRILILLTGNNEVNQGKEAFRDLYRQGNLDDIEVDVDIPAGASNASAGTFFGRNDTVIDIDEVLRGLNVQIAKKTPTDRKKMPISQAREALLEIEIEKLMENVDVKKEAIAAVEESGIVVIDEIDKICTSSDFGYRSGGDASSEGVQRDLLAVIEGTTVSTKHGNVNTDYILFVACGAFHSVKPSDLLPELQGRLPIRVELKGLNEDDLYRILTEPVTNVSPVYQTVVVMEVCG